MSTPVVSKADAVKVLGAVKRQFKAWLEPGGENGPKLVKDFDYLGTGPAPYAVVWEEGPYEWAMLAGGGGIEEEFGFNVKPVTFPETVQCEAYTSWALAVYPA